MRGDPIISSVNGGGGWLQRFCRQALNLYRRVPEPLRERIARMRVARLRAQVAFPKSAAWSAKIESPGHTQSLAPPKCEDVLGVNLFGFFRGQFGLGESARSYARALIAAGIPIAVHDVDLKLPHGWSDHSMDAWMKADAPYPISIIFVNPDFIEAALEQIGLARLQGHYLIGCWFWELEQIPEQWRAALELVDEVLVASTFIENAFREMTNKPITRIPLPLSEVPDSGLQRSDFGIDEGKFAFLTSFDFNSSVERKNPLGVIHAFMRAFPPGRDDVQLLVKSSNGSRYPQRLADLLAEARQDHRIMVRDQIIDRSHIAALQRCCDAYVSLHRAEGFGLGLAESMSLGKPVVATNWSGNLEFMDPSVSLLVGYQLVPVKPGEYPFVAGGLWADPNLDDAANALRRLADDPPGAAKLGALARNSIRAKLMATVIGSQLGARLAELSRDSNTPRGLGEGRSCLH